MKEYKPTPTRIKVIEGSLQTDYWPQYKSKWLSLVDKWIDPWVDFDFLWAESSITALLVLDKEFGSKEWAEVVIDGFLEQQKTSWEDRMYKKETKTISYMDYPGGE